MYHKTHPFPSKIGCNIVYSDNGLATIEKDESELVYTVNIVVYPMNLIRERASNDQRYFVLIALEELCHALYLEQNEYRAKELAATIAQQIFHDLKVQDYFDKFFDKDGNRIPHPELGTGYET